MDTLLFVLTLVIGYLACSFFNAACCGLADRFDSSSEVEDFAFNGIVGTGPLGTVFILIVGIIFLSLEIYKKVFTNNPFLVIYEFARYRKFGK